ncbi:F-box protein [Dorcoceras hygrometricum]|uniref:F-box protein n=1 Tax=Dorcoceras hygrometricum TaxID=472368 RepID=A0A2Z7D8G0_9LAMI|nr:F-box protein [Dorcoceras hygrometricum]
MPWVSLAPLLVVAFCHTAGRGGNPAGGAPGGGKWVYLVTLAMSLFDLQDVCIVIGSLATLDLPLVVDLIGIYVLKGPYYTLTTTNWFLQALSVIPMGSWGDVSRRFTMIRWVVAPPPPLKILTVAASTAAPSCRRCRDRTCSDRRVEEIPFVPNLSGLLVQAEEGVVFPVVDLIEEDLPPPTLKSQIPCESGWSQAPRRQQGATAGERTECET